MTPKTVAQHMSNETANESTSADVHTAAAEAFVDRARSQHGDEIAELYVFGSTVRGETHGLASDVDVLIVLDDDADHEATADALRDIAYDAMLKYGPVVELHILSESTFTRYQQEGNPFIRNVVTEGRSYA
jgi:predicted nucleotidyltransferase